MRDLVSFDRKHNEANGEDNRDGTTENLSWNGGVEGETEDPAVLANRWERRVGLMTALLSALGVPMILAGDEIGQTQQGNNNAYSQDTDLSWIDWERADWAFFAVARDLIAKRKATPGMRREAFHSGAEDPATGRRDVTWLDSRGRPRLTPEDWNRDSDVLGMRLGEADPADAPIMLRAPRR